MHIELQGKNNIKVSIIMKIKIKKIIKMPKYINLVYLNKIKKTLNLIINKHKNQKNLIKIQYLFHKEIYQVEKKN